MYFKIDTLDKEFAHLSYMQYYIALEKYFKMTSLMSNVTNVKRRGVPRKKKKIHHSRLILREFDGTLSLS